jgi:hypothetical protein
MKPYIDPEAILNAAVHLFARVPDLPKKLGERAERDKVANKVVSFFDCLFVGSSNPALGANYNVIGYRLRDMDEICPIDGASNDNFLDDHKITPEMVSE